MAPRPSILEPRWPQDPNFAAKMAQSTSQIRQLGATMPPKSPNFDPKCTPTPPNFEPEGPQDLDKISSHPGSNLGGSMGQDRSSELGGSIGGPAAGGEALEIRRPSLQRGEWRAKYEIEVSFEVSPEESPDF